MVQQWYNNGTEAEKKLGALDLQGLRKCGKQDLKSEAAVNNASFCIIRDKAGIKSDKIDQYHTL